MPFNIGPGELIIVLIIALIVVGPGKLPDVGASLGKSIREFRKAASDVTDSTKLEAAAPAAAAAAPAATPAAPAPVTPAPAAPSPNVISGEAVPNTISTPAPTPVAEAAPQAPASEAAASDEQPTPTA